MKKLLFFLWFLFVAADVPVAQTESTLNGQAWDWRANWKGYFTLDPREGRSFALDTTAVLLDASVPSFHITLDEQIILGFAGGVHGLGQAITTDKGRTFVRLTGYAAPVVPDGAFIYLPDGRIRFIAEEPLPGSTPWRHRSHLVSWISTDGLNWAGELGVRYAPGAEDDSIASVPAAVQVADSLWRLYYVGDWYGSNGIRTAISTDWGWTWQPESRGNILRNNDVDPHPVYLTDGRIRIYHRHMREPGGIAFTEGDGLVFDTARTQMVIPDYVQGTGLQLDPAVIKFADGRIGCFIGTMSISVGMRKPRIIAAWATDVATSSEVQSTARSNCTLFPNYPNPFNQTTILRFAVSQRSGVTLTVFDALGRKVVTLVDGVLDPGEHTVIFDGGSLPGGIYLCCLRNGNKRWARKAMLLK